MRKLTFISLIFHLSIQLAFAQVLDSLVQPELKVTRNGDLDKYEASIQKLFSEFDTAQVSSGILYDIAPSLSNIENYTGDKNSRTSSRAVFNQILLELEKASLNKKKYKSLNAITPVDNNTISIALMNFNYNKIKEDAMARGLIQYRTGKYVTTNRLNESPFLMRKVFAATALKEHTYQGSLVTFNLNKKHYFSNSSEKFSTIQIDFDDGSGYQNVAFDQDISVSYPTEGIKMITIKATDANNKTLTSQFLFSVEALSSPTYTSIALRANIPYKGVYAEGTAYLYKSPVTPEVRNPVIILEGLDTDNSMFADELYAFLNQQNLADKLRNNGYDIIIVNYKESRTYIQANAMLVVKAIQQVNTQLKVGKNSNIIIGASMGGLVGRYALRYMETHPETGDHQTRLFCSFDSPQKGANIPLGDQYWINFFAAENATAATKIAQLNTIAPQQMLVYHHLTYPYSNALRTTLVNELKNLGYPQKCRTIAVANGSATGTPLVTDTGIPYKPGDQLVKWYYRSFTVDIDGNTWAVPNLDPLTRISQCKIDKVFPFPDRSESHSVRLTLPYDIAPGGFRATNKEIADTQVDYGDITTNRPNHSFIPTISALDINTTNLFYNIKGDPDILSKTPFKAIYYPVNDTGINQAHVAITNETVGWIFDELVPNHIVLDGNTRNAGEIKAKQSITFLPGFHADAKSELYAFLGTYTLESAIASNLRLGKVEKTLLEEIDISHPTVIDDYLDNSQIIIYPNPNNGKFSIVMGSAQKTEIKIYNLAGGFVYETYSDSDIINIDLSHCSNGLYHLKIKRDNDQLLTKIIVNK